MDGDKINGIQRLYELCENDDDDEMTYLNDEFDLEAFHVYDHEKIGFIDTDELKELRDKVGLFKADMCNPKRHTVGVIGVKRMVWKYNQLYLDVLESEYLFEHKIDMLKLYEDLFGLKNIFTQKKGFQLIVSKCNELMYCTDNKSKIKLLKWFLRNERKVSDFLISHNTIEIEENRMVYYYFINGKEHRLVIRHPTINMDVEACHLLQSYIMPFYDYLLIELFKANAFKRSVSSKGMLYEYFKDKIEHVMEPCEEWIYSR